MKNYLVIINLVIISTITWFTADRVYGKFELDTGKMDSTGKSVMMKMGPEKSVKKKIKPELTYKIINERNLFNTEEIKVTTKKPVKTTLIDLSKIPKTSLSLQLLGTVIGNVSEPYAIILDKKKKEQDLYNVNDKIQSAGIKEILNRKVVLNVNGKDEILIIEDTTFGKNDSAKGPKSPGASDSSSDTGISKKVDVSLKRDYIDGIIANPLSVISDARVNPYLKDEQMSGLIISHIKRNSVFSKAGLKNGDIIKSINGEEIQSMDNMMGYYENLKDESNVSVTVTRRGRTMQIDYSIN